MTAALSLMSACRPATPFTDRVISILAVWDDDGDDWLDIPRKQPTECQCFGPGEAGGYCPGPEHCPMFEDEDQ